MFEMYTDKAGEYRFRLKAKNGQNILASEGYSTKSACENGIDSVKKNATDESKFEKKTTDGGKFRFNLKSGNGQVIGTSQSYDSEAGRDNGIQSVMNNAPEAEVKEVKE